MSNALVLGSLLLLGALGTLVYALFGSTGPRVPKGRRRAVDEPETPALPVAAWSALTQRLDSKASGGGFSLIRQQELDAADVAKPVGVVLAWTALGGLGAVLVATVLLGSIWLGLVLLLLSPVGTKLYLRVLAGRRRKRFGDQLDPTLRIIASALRAGQSLPMAMASVAADAEEPMRQELGRVVNENRVGRDLVEALLNTADRMRSEDLRWFAEAVEVQRDTGGNLNDIIDTVAETIRDRAEIRAKIDAYASEGKASAAVLMGLPIALALVYSVMNPGYLDPLFATAIGVVLLAASAVMYVVAFFWMRAIVNIKV